MAKITFVAYGVSKAENTVEPMYIKAKNIFEAIEISTAMSGKWGWSRFISVAEETNRHYISNKHNWHKNKHR